MISSTLRLVSASVDLHSCPIWLDHMTNPYQSPHGPGTQGKQSIRLGVILLIIGVTMPILGLAGTIGSMMYSFKQVAGEHNVSPDRIANGISISLVVAFIAAIIGIVVGAFGIVLIVAARRGNSSD